MRESEFEFGRIGRMKGTGKAGDFTFMVLCETPDPDIRMFKPSVVEVIILSGTTWYGDRLQGFGDIGPVAIASGIEWLE